MMFRSKLFENTVLRGGDMAFGTSVRRELNRLRREQTMTPAQLAALQREKLERLLAYCRNNPYYGPLLRHASSDPYEALKQLPILDKETYSRHQEEITAGKGKGKVHQISSSGSTGFRTTVFLDQQAYSVTKAVHLLWMEWAGYQLGDPLIQTGNYLQRGFFKGLKDKAFRTTYLPAFNLSEEFVLEQFRQWKNTTGKVLGGYASSIVLMAQVAHKHRIEDVRFKTIISWASKMSDVHRDFIERRFGCDVYDTYGCAEGLMVAAQYRDKKYYTIPSHLIVEILNDAGEEVAPGEFGHIMLTGLDNFATPMLRYKLGDLARKAADTERTPGINFPVIIDEVVGRATEVIRVNGALLTIHSVTKVMFHYPEIREYSMIQRRPDEVELHFVKERDFPESVFDRIREDFKRNLKHSIPITFIPVEEVKTYKSGKKQIIQSLIPNKI